MKDAFAALDTIRDVLTEARVSVCKIETELQSTQQDVSWLEETMGKAADALEDALDFHDRCESFGWEDRKAEVFDTVRNVVDQLRRL